MRGPTPAACWVVGEPPGAECKGNRWAAPPPLAAGQVHLLHVHQAAVQPWIIIGYSLTANFLDTSTRGCMRSRERILGNLETIYRESYDRAQKHKDEGRMIDLESGYMRDQLMLEILLDIRDLFSVAPAASGGSALEKLEAIRRLTKLR